MHRTLDISTDATHRVLHDRLNDAVADHRLRGRPGAPRARGDFPHTDEFLASTSRHIAAVSAVLLPAARRDLDDGAERAREFVRHVRRLEMALAQVKAKLYGEAHAIHRRWGAVWADVGDELDATLAREQDLVDGLLGVLDDERLDELAGRLYHAELHSPTRPHPFLPHQGLAGRLARRMANTVDQFWDGTENRMIPEPIRPHGHHDGLFTHYLLADTDPDTDPAADDEAR